MGTIIACLYAYGNDSVSRGNRCAGGIGGNCWSSVLELVTGVGSSAQVVGFTLDGSQDSSSRENGGDSTGA